MHYFDILFDKGKNHVTPEVGLDEEGANGLGGFIRYRITGNGRHDIFNVFKDLDSHGMYHKRSLV